MEDNPLELSRRKTPSHGKGRVGLMVVLALLPLLLIAAGYGVIWRERSLADYYPAFAQLQRGPAVELPKQRHGYSPQGIALWQGDGQDSWLLVSKKHPRRASLLTLVNTEQAQVQRRLTILDHSGAAHPTGVGGAAVAKGHIFLVSNNGLEGFIGVIPDDVLARAVADPQQEHIQPRWIPIAQRACVSLLDGDQLWAISFVMPGHHRFGFEDDATIFRDGQKHPRGSAYSLRELVAWQSGDPPPEPVAQAAWPLLMQGAAILGEDLWLSRSWSTQASALECFAVAELRAGHVGQGTPQFSIAVPRFGEGLWATEQGHLWMVFEGATPGRQWRMALRGLYAEGRALRLEPDDSSDRLMPSG